MKGKIKEPNKFLSRSRDREKWKRKLSGQLSNAAKAEAIYFRPTVSDDQRIRDLAELLRITKNSVVEKLVAGALNNRQPLVSKIDEQKGALRHLEEQTEMIAGGQIELLTMLDEMRKRLHAQERLSSFFLSEIYCMVHTIVSLVRTVLLQILGLTSRETENEPLPPPSPDILTSFDETSDLTIARSLEDLEAAARYYGIENPQLHGENLFWKSKLRNSVSEPEEG